ncbi:hypothetical protein JCM17823_22200 [Halorubrum gandharaense]
MNLNRRNVLAGLGAAAVGTGAAFGSGAFTSVEAEREVTVDVAEDAEAQVGLNADDDDDVEGVSNSQLAINLDDVNPESTVRLGEVDDTSDEVTTSAFSIENNTDQSFDSGEEIEVEAEVDDIGDGDDNIELIAEDPDGSLVDLHEESEEVTLSSSENASVAVEIFVEGEEFEDGDITFSAENTAHQT